MAVYKVAQDVEADDKLIGPFSFRQFVYLIIVAISIGLAWGLGQVFIGLAIIPLPIILFFGALALPLRKDQPMEVYMAALVSYYIKPRKRLWESDGIESLVEITVPKVVEVHRAKDITESEAEQRLSYLADIADTEGWAIRHAAMPFPAVNTPMANDEYFAAQQTEDVLDENGGVSQTLGQMIDRSDEQRKQQMVARMQQQFTQQSQQAYVPPIADPYAALGSSPAPSTQTQVDASVQYNPYPNQIHQAVISPIYQKNQAAQSTPSQPPVPMSQTDDQNTSTIAVSPDIISLANNTDLSIETIQREANRIQERDDKDDEVFISLH